MCLMTRTFYFINEIRKIAFHAVKDGRYDGTITYRANTTTATATANTSTTIGTTTASDTTTTTASDGFDGV